MQPGATAEGSRGAPGFSPLLIALGDRVPLGTTGVLGALMRRTLDARRI